MLLTKIPTLTNAVEVFAGGNVEHLINDVENEVRSVVHDVSTASGRKQIASLAFKVSRSKTALDELGKGLVKEWKERSKAVDMERKQVRDRLDALRDEVRAPLTQWEETERIRVEKEALDKAVAEAHELALAENELFDRQAEVDRKLEEIRLAELQRAQEEREKKAEKARIEREKRLQQEAAERARQEVEEEARRKVEEAERREIETRVAAEERRLRDIQELNQKQERLERARVEAEAEKIRKENAKKAAAERKAADVDNQRRVNSEVLDAITTIGITQKHAILLITNIVRGNVPHVTITY